jgi:predicted lipid-binding transport protein (Tim44 family)
MNRSAHGYSKRFSIVVLAGAFLVESAMPVFANPQSAGQSDSTRQQASTLPDAPEAQAEQPQQPPSTPPSGAAGAKAAPVKGAPVAQPAGAAVAPVRQRGHRSLLIKAGLIAGAAVAVGVVVALSDRSPTRPPGAASTSAHQ